ncbi:MAG: hypothetical protein ACR2QC_11695 [Gammaproteobacteria bacterium]
MTTKLLAAVLFALPAPLVFWGGWILTVGGAAAFISGLFVKKHYAGKFRVNAGFCAVLFGLVMILFPDHPTIAIALLFLLVLFFLWAFYGFLTAFLFS